MKTKKEMKYKFERYKGAKLRLKKYNESKKRQRIDNTFSKPKRISFRIIWVVLFILSIFYAAFRCNLSYSRLFASICDLGISFAYYLTWFFSYEITPTVNDLPNVEIVSFLPYNFEALGEKLSNLWSNIWNSENFKNYIIEGSDGVETFCKVCIIVLPLLLVFRLWIDSIINARNVDWNIKTKAYKVYEKILDKTYYPAKKYVLDFVDFSKGHYYYELFLGLWCCNLNVVTIIVGFVAWYIYFARAFTFLNVYIQFVKLGIDIAIFFKVSFLALSIFIIYKIINRIRRNVADNKLNSLEAKLDKTVSDFPIAIYITGAPGTKKTSTVVNIALTKTIQYRNAALERLFKWFTYFPDFPWLRLEKQICMYIKQHKVYNIASIEKMYHTTEFKFTSYKRNFGYDMTKYKTVYNDGVNDIGIWEAVETYAKLYFVYIIESSLLVSNFSIREDYIVDNCGNFILYDNDVYSHPVTDKDSHFAHILNYDTLRVGRLLSDNEKIRNSFEFGILCGTEFGKERGSHLENLVVRKNDETCNVKNDLLAYKMKFSRHGGIIDNFVFVTWFLDEQRVTSLDPDIRDCCDVIRLTKTSKTRLAYPFYYFESAIYDLLKAMFKPLWARYRHSHGNRTLLAYLVKHPIIMLMLYMERRMNKYAWVNVSYMRWNCGSEDDKKEEAMPLVALKVYKKRYATDTHKTFFRKRALNSGLGLMDIPCYDSIVATESELSMQNSFMITTMENLSKQNEDEEKSENI